MSIELSNKEQAKVEEVRRILDYRKDNPNASYRQIAAELKIGKSKISRVLNGNFNLESAGRPRGFTDKQTLELVAIFKFLGEFGVPPVEKVCLNIANNYLKIYNIGKKKDKTVGRSWFKSFYNLHKHNLKPDHIAPDKLFNPDLTRFRSTPSSDLIQEWTEILNNILLDAGLARVSNFSIPGTMHGMPLEIINPKSIFTADITALIGNLIKREPVYLPVGQTGNDAEFDVLYDNKNYKVVSGLFCSNLEGDLLKPLVCFPKRILDSNAAALQGDASIYMTANGSGWITGKVFVDFVKKYLIEEIKKRTPPNCKPILLLNTHGSFATLELFKCLKNNDILVLAFPPNSADYFSPMEHSFLPFFKNEMEALNSQYDMLGLSETHVLLKKVQQVLGQNELMKVKVIESWRSAGIVYDDNRRLFTLDSNWVSRVSSKDPSSSGLKRSANQSGNGNTMTVSHHGKVTILNDQNDVNLPNFNVSDTLLNWQ